MNIFNLNKNFYPDSISFGNNLLYPIMREDSLKHGQK